MSKVCLGMSNKEHTTRVFLEKHVIILNMSETITKKKRIRPYVKKDIKIKTPKQIAFKEYYTNPKSETFNNAYRSGLKAGFSESYSSQILFNPMSWLLDIQSQIGDERRLAKAESNLEEYQNLNIYREDNSIDSGVLANKIKVDTFIAQTHDKIKYSTRTENAVLVKVEHTIDEETRKRLDALL